MTNTNSKIIKCHVCGNETTFDLSKFPKTGLKFDYKCEKCGTFNMIKIYGTKES